jgi:hypothetical protein
MLVSTNPSAVIQSDHVALRQTEIGHELSVAALTEGFA